MSTISAIGSSAGAWPAMGSPGRVKEQLFAKVDADGSGGVDGPRPPPPPSGSSSDRSSAATITDPLDTNEDGTVSAQERAAGGLAEAMKTLMKAMGSDGDKQVSSSERDSFVSTMTKMLKQYEQTTANLSTEDSATSLSVAA